MLGYILHHLEQIVPVGDAADDVPVLGAKSIAYIGSAVIGGSLKLSSRGWREANPADLQCHVLSISILNAVAQYSHSVSRFWW